MFQSQLIFFPMNVEVASVFCQLSAYMLYQCLETDISGLKEVTEII